VDELDRKLLKLLQNNLPITPEPYKDLALSLHIDQKEVLYRVKKLKEKGIIRRIGGVFDSRKLGYKSTLCAMSVPRERLREVKEIVNSYPGVTHNYLREHSLNMWFTLIEPSQEKLERTISEISQKTGLPVRNLPALRLFKIKVEFQIPKGEDNLAE
jgi:DNA-binding Lrp family transcriptional regulator